MDEDSLWLALRLVPGLRRVEAWRLIERFGTPAELFRRAPSELIGEDGVRNARTARAISAGPDERGVAGMLDASRRAGMRVWTAGHADMPERLLRIDDAPLAIWVRGEFPRAGPVLSVVGSRKATRRSRDVALRLSRETAAAGAVIASGLAYGIDGAAHRGAVEAGAPNIAVLASGLDRPSPSGHVRLAHQILDVGGAWLSEHPPGTPALAHHFPERNRLISGLADRVWVVEARERSGSLWTAQHAREQGREVLACPGPIDTELCAGSNALLRTGATPVLDADDLRLSLGLAPRSAEVGPALAAAGLPADGAAARIWLRLADGSVDSGVLARDLGLAAAQLAAATLDLELAGLVERRGAALARTRR